MNNPYPVAIRPVLPPLVDIADGLEPEIRQLLASHYQRLLALAIRAEMAQRIIGALHIATANTVEETLWAAEVLSARRRPIGVSLEETEWAQPLRDQYVATAEQLVVLANEEVLRWLFEE